VININNTRTNMEKNEMNKKSNVDELTDVTYMVSNSIEWTNDECQCSYYQHWMDHRVLLSVYYIDRCELWGFIREINSGIFTYENISFFPPELLLHNYKCGGYVPCCVTVNTHTIVNWKKFLEMSLTTLTHYQHDVIDVMWKLPVWLIDWLIDWCLTSKRAIFQLYSGREHLKI
jgi:hypothetical protein